MLYIKIDGLKELQDSVDDLIKSRIPKMTAMTLTAAAKALKDETKEEMKRVFDRPNSWTLGGIFYKSASVDNMNAYVWFKDEGAGKGTPAAKYLLPEIEGGPRNLKRFERALNRFGVLPSGYYTVPGQGARIDRYGNISQGQITQILAAVGALIGMSDAVFNGKVGGFKKHSGTTDIFLVRTKRGGVVPGIWERLAAGEKETDYTRDGKVHQLSSRKGGYAQVIQGRRVRPLLIFVKGAPTYKRRFPFFEWGQDFVGKVGTMIFRRIAVETLADWNTKRSA